MSTAIVICADSSPVPSGDPGWTVVADLCRRPEQLATAAAGATALVLGVCGGRFSLGAVQRAVRRSGLDPLGVEIVDLLAAGDDADRRRVLIAGAAGRAAAYAGSRPDQSKLTFARTVDRRALLTFALPEYQAAPAVDFGRCAADRGCRGCIDVCPQDAFKYSGGRLVHDRNACEPCGRCVTACPTGAVVNPAATPAAIEAHVRALLDRATGTLAPRGIAFRCRRGSSSKPAAHWYDVTVPCSAMVTSGWVLAALALGAGAVAVRPCSDVGCPLGGDGIVAERLAWCAELLVALGVAGDRVTDDPTTLVPPAPITCAPVSDPFGPLGAAGVVLALADSVAGDSVGTSMAAADVGASLGIVAIDADVCTGCAMCAASCPTGALGVSAGVRDRSLSFDARMCTACGVCTTRCPEEGALTLTRGVDVDALRLGSTAVWQGSVVACRSCGAPVAPDALLRRLAALIDDEAITRSISRQCSDCRGVALPV